MVGRGKEEEYFRRTIYEPAVAQRQKGKEGDAAPKVSVDAGRKEAASTGATVGHATDRGATSSGEEEDAGPPPVRPSKDVFRAIFDAGSDISSSDDDDRNEPERNGRHTAARARKCGVKSAPNENYTDDETKNSNGATPDEGTAADANDTKCNPLDRAVDDGASWTDGSASRNSRSSRRRREYHRRRRRRSRHDGDRDTDDEDRKKRKWKENVVENIGTDDNGETTTPVNPTKNRTAATITGGEIRTPGIDLVLGTRGESNRV